MTRIRDRVVDAAPGVRVAVTEVGAGPVVMLQHGVASSREFLVEAFGPPLVAAGWQLAAVDVRGHGQGQALTSESAYALDRLVEDVACLVEVLRPRVIGGVSLGAHAAVAAVATGVQVEAVVACLPAWIGTMARGVGPHAAIADTVRDLGVPAIIEHMQADAEMPSWLRQTLVRDWLASDPRSLAAALCSLDGGHAPTFEQLSDLPAPLGVVGWPDDPGHPIHVAREWADVAPIAAHTQITMDEVGANRSALGAALLQTLEHVGVTPESMARTDP